jgi:hypothetical protein
VGVFPLAFIAGTVRETPFFRQLIDCSFGFFGGILLWMCYSKVKELQEASVGVSDNDVYSNSIRT